MKKTIIQFLWVALLSLTITGHVMAQNAQDALDTVKLSVKSAIDDLKVNKALYQSNPEKLNGMIDSKVLPYFDTEAMARLVLAQNWRSASASQRSNFLNEFKMLILRTYSTRLLAYTDAKFKYGQPTPVKKNRTKIEVTVLHDNGQTHSVRLSMGYRNSKWKAYDVSMNGLSVITSYRSSIGEEISKEGLQTVIDEIKELNAKGQVFKNGD
ncbi:MAG: MlaC/ttg2D family ABC transporter substrate-binding protein [Ostreibacterium sp.]